MTDWLRGDVDEARDAFVTPSVDVGRLERLPEPLIREFREWLKAEGLFDKKVVYLRLLTGGRIAVDQLVKDEAGRVILNAARDAPLLESRVYPISTLPPMAALS